MSKGNNKNKRIRITKTDCLDKLNIIKCMIFVKHSKNRPQIVLNHKLFVVPYK